MVAATIAPAPAPATPGAVVVATAISFAPGGTRGGIVDETGPLVVPAGTDVLFVSAEVLVPDAHTMTSAGCYSLEEPCWFDSGDPVAQQPGETAVVATSHLPRGTYPFLCSVHQHMRGVLTIV